MTRVPAWPDGGSNSWHAPFRNRGTTPRLLSVAMSSCAAVRRLPLTPTVDQYSARNCSATVRGIPEQCLSVRHSLGATCQ